MRNSHWGFHQISEQVPDPSEKNPTIPVNHLLSHVFKLSTSSIHSSITFRTRYSLVVPTHTVIRQMESLVVLLEGDFFYDFFLKLVDKTIVFISCRPLIRILVDWSRSSSTYLSTVDN